MTTTTVDMVVCLDSSFSISFHHDSICSSMVSIAQRASDINPNNIRMAFIPFQSHCDQWFTQTYPFTSSVNTFEQSMRAVQTNGDDSNDKKAIIDALGEALLVEWRTDNNSEQMHEKMVILITNGPPCNLLGQKCPCSSADLWKMADRFAAKNITLVVIGIEPTVICDDFYCALAKKTGGEYLPFINSTNVLSDIISDAIRGSNTFRQLFLRLDVRWDIERRSSYSYSYAQKRATEMFKDCKSMADIRTLFYACFNRFIEPTIDEVTIENNDSDFEPGSPPMHSHYMNTWLSADINIVTSTPVTDDEGYRTRLPTRATSESTSSTPGAYFQLREYHSELNSDSAINGEITRENNDLNLGPLLPNGNYLIHRYDADINILGLTSVTDDEGHYTRLPTTASDDPDFPGFILAQEFLNESNMDSDGEIDDDVFNM